MRVPSASDALDLLGLILLAAGLGFLVHGAVRLLTDSGSIQLGAGLVAAAVVVLAGSWLSDRRHREDR